MNRKKPFLLLLFLSFSAFAQPGPGVLPRDINLNTYPNFPGITIDNLKQFNFRIPELGEITIDSTSDLSIIPLLKKEKSLSLNIKLHSIPGEFKDFTQTKALKLTLHEKMTDLSFLNEFPDLECLNLWMDGDLAAGRYLRLDSLKTLYVYFSPHLTNLNAFEKISSLTSITLKIVPLLKELPKFSEFNMIKSLSIEKEMGDGCQNCPPNPSKIDLSNLKQLRQLENLTLVNVTELTEIPDYWSKHLKQLRIFSLDPRFKEDGFGVKLKSVSNLGKYPKLETLELYGVGLKGSSGYDFNRLKLKKRSLSTIYYFQD